jgi:hypothetical protein
VRHVHHRAPHRRKKGESGGELLTANRRIG